jgi:hypothetical protein
MPRAGPVEFHALLFSFERESPRDKPIASDFWKSGELFNTFCVEDFPFSNSRCASELLVLQNLSRQS